MGCPTSTPILAKRNPTAPRFAPPRRRPRKGGQSPQLPPEREPTPYSKPIPSYNDDDNGVSWPSKPIPPWPATTDDSELGPHEGTGVVTVIIERESEGSSSIPTNVKDDDETPPSQSTGVKGDSPPLDDEEGDDDPGGESGYAEVEDDIPTSAVTTVGGKVASM